MITWIAKNAPDFSMMAGLYVMLAVVFGVNWALSDIIGNDIVKHDGSCSISDYNEETRSGIVKCGEYTTDGKIVLVDFVGLVYVQNLSVSCKISEHEYTEDIDWTCQTDDSVE